VVSGSGFATRCGISIAFKDAARTITGLAGIPGSATFTVSVTIPVGAALGPGTIRAFQLVPHPHGPFCDGGVNKATASFTVTASPRQFPGWLVMRTPADRLAPSFPQIRVRPTSGPAGMKVGAEGRGFVGEGNCQTVLIFFTDAEGTITEVGGATAPSFQTTVTIPPNAVQGPGTVVGQIGARDPHNPRRCVGGASASAAFTVTGGPGTSVAVQIRPFQKPAEKGVA